MDGGHTGPVMLSQGKYGATVGTDLLLELLDEKGVKGTWFITGWTCDHYPGQAAKIAAAGHATGAHGYLHENLGRVADRQITVRAIPLFPLRLASVLSWPFNPYLRHLVSSVRLMNVFPKDEVEKVPQIVAELTSTFDYPPTTLEMEARRRFKDRPGDDE